MLHPLQTGDAEKNEMCKVWNILTLPRARENIGIHHSRTACGIRTVFGDRAESATDSDPLALLLDRGHATRDPIESPCPSPA